MPYTESHILLTVMGDAYLQTETWQFGVRLRHPVPGATNSDLQLLADAMAAPTQTLWSTAAMAFSDKCRLTAIKAARVLETGLYPPDSIPGVYTYPAPVVGTNAASVTPQATVACTLLTNWPRGRASRGRFYLPPQGVTLATDGRMTIGVVDAFETTLKTWLNAVRLTAQAEEVLVMSKLDAGKTGVVDRIGVGRVVDTMRSRRRSLIELRTPLAL